MTVWGKPRECVSHFKPLIVFWLTTYQCINQDKKWHAMSRMLQMWPTRPRKEPKWPWNRGKSSMIEFSFFAYSVCMYVCMYNVVKQKCMSCKTIYFRFIRRSLQWMTCNAIKYLEGLCLDNSKFEHLLC